MIRKVGQQKTFYLVTAFLPDREPDYKLFVYIRQIKQVQAIAFRWSPKEWRTDTGYRTTIARLGSGRTCPTVVEQKDLAFVKAEVPQVLEKEFSFHPIEDMTLRNPSKLNSWSQCQTLATLRKFGLEHLYKEKLKWW